MSDGADRRVYDHPILGPLSAAGCCMITVDGKQLVARRGEPILATLLAAGITVTHWTEKHQEPRGLFCGIGVCTDCLVTVNGIPNVRSCVTPVEDQMIVETRPSGGAR